MEEIWKEIENYNSRYFISNFGKVKSVNGKIKLLKHRPCREYLTVSLNKNGEGKNVLIHRLVATYFVLNPNNYTEVDHIDCNPKNNAFSNLRWVNRSINTKNKKTARICKTSNIKGVTPDGNQLLFKTTTECCKYLNKPNSWSYISHCAKYNKNAYGYKWSRV